MSLLVRNEDPDEGLEIETVGALFPTVIVTVAVALDPFASATVAVMVWVPFESVLVSVAPVPSAPSRLDVHAIEPLSPPSSKSEAVPWREMASLVRNAAALTGDVIETEGGVLATVTMTDADDRRPSESVTVAVIVCVPLESFRENVPPSPICPSRFEVHTIEPVRSPSSASLALPRNATVSAVRTAAPSEGAWIETVGASPATEIETDVEPVASSASVALAVMTWVPLGSERLKLAPEPIRPATSEVQTIVAVTSPSSKSLAVALNVIVECVDVDVPSIGLDIATDGGALATVIAIVAILAEPSASTTLAVIVCAPRERCFVSVPPVPSTPSTSDVHVIDGVRSPSSKSLAVASRRMSSLVVKAAPLPGLEMAISGGAFATVTDTEAVRLAPLPSVTLAVTTFAPGGSLAASAPPLPRTPTLSDVQTIDAVRSPSSRSEALPWNAMSSLVSNDVPVAGVRMETIGAASPTAIVTDALRLAPSESVAVAVIVCVPALSDRTKLPPVPIP